MRTRSETKWYDGRSLGSLPVVGAHAVSVSPRLVAGAKYLNGPEMVTAHSVVPPVSWTVSRVGRSVSNFVVAPGNEAIFFICP